MLASLPLYYIIMYTNRCYVIITATPFLSFFFLLYIKDAYRVEKFRYRVALFKCSRVDESGQASDFIGRLGSHRWFWPAKGRNFFRGCDKRAARECWGRLERFSFFQSSRFSVWETWAPLLRDFTPGEIALFSGEQQGVRWGNAITSRVDRRISWKSGWTDDGESEN